MGRGLSERRRCFLRWWEFALLRYLGATWTRPDYERTYFFCCVLNSTCRNPFSSTHRSRFESLPAVLDPCQFVAPVFGGLLLCMDTSILCQRRVFSSRSIDFDEIAIIKLTDFILQFVFNTITRSIDVPYHFMKCCWPTNLHASKVSSEPSPLTAQVQNRFR